MFGERHGSAMPFLHNRIYTTSEKLNMIFNILVVKILFSLMNAIILEPKLIVITKLKVSTVKQLVIFVMAK